MRPEYAAEITEPFRLWSAGNDEWARSRATREPIDWWIDHPRLTFARWQKMRRDAVRIAYEEAASLTETGSWEVPAAWAAETTEEATDGHDAAVDGPPPRQFDMDAEDQPLTLFDLGETDNSMAERKPDACGTPDLFDLLEEE